MTELKSIPIAVLLLVAIGVLPAGCRQVDRFNDPYVSNNTGTPLDILYARNNQTTSLHVTAVSGQLTPLAVFRDGCSDGTLIAVDRSGNEIARYDRPLCAGDTWSIGPGSTVLPSIGVGRRHRSELETLELV